MEDSWRRPALVAQGNTGLLGMFHDWGRRNPGMMEALQQQPFTGPLLTVADMLGSQLSFVQQMQARDEAWREARSNGASIGELVTAPVEADDPLLSLALGTVVPFGRAPVRPIPEQSAARAGIATAVPRGQIAMNLGFAPQRYYYATTGNLRSFGPHVRAREDALSPARQAYILAETPEAALRQAGLAATEEGVNIMPLLVRRGRSDAFRTHGMHDSEIASTLNYAYRPPAGAPRLDTVQMLTPGGDRLLAVFNPARIRSEYAAFDPRSIRRRRNLLAGVGGGGLLTVASPGAGTE